MNNQEEIWKDIKGYEGYNSKLTDRRVSSIRRIFNGYNHKKLAKKYNVKLSTIYSVVNKASWKHVKK